MSIVSHSDAVLTGIINHLSGCAVVALCSHSVAGRCAGRGCALIRQLANCVTLLMLFSLVSVTEDDTLIMMVPT